MKTEVIHKEAVVQVIEPEVNLINIQLTKEEAKYLTAVLGNRNGSMCGAYKMLNHKLYHALNDFTGDTSSYTGDAAMLNQAESARFNFLRAHHKDNL
jgi:hypothetical protein